MPTPNPQRILRQHLETDRLLGVTAVPVPKSFSLDHAPTQLAPPAQAPAQHPQARPAPPRPQAPAPPPRQAPLITERVPIRSGLSTTEKVQALQDLQQAFEQDPAVQAQRPNATQLVWGEGDVDAQIMFIGEGPGEVEDRLGRPFVGPAGELLDKMITAMGLTREGVYIANVAKYRPPGNRVPTQEECETAGPYLAKQVAIVAPKVIVGLGGSAVKFAMQTTTGITRLRGRWSTFAHTDPTIPLMPTFHPAYLLRSYTTDNRKMVWEDLQAVLKRVEG